LEQTQITATSAAEDFHRQELCVLRLSLLRYQSECEHISYDRILYRFGREISIYRKYSPSTFNCLVDAALVEERDTFKWEEEKRAYCNP
jgi:hypothetical protein